jgi:hypothetical protein
VARFASDVATVPIFRRSSPSGFGRSFPLQSEKGEALWIDSKWFLNQLLRIPYFLVTSARQIPAGSLVRAASARIPFESADAAARSPGT